MQPNLFTTQLGLCNGGVISLVGAGGKTSLMFCLARMLSASGGTVLTTTTTKIFVPQPDISPLVMIAPTANDLLDRVKRVPPEGRHVTAGREILAPVNKLAGYTPSDIAELYESGRFKWIIVEADGAARHPLKAPADHEPVIPACTGWLIIVAGLDSIGLPLTEKTVFRSEQYSRITGTPLGMPVTEESVATALVHDQGGLKGAPQAARRWLFLNKADTADRRQQAYRVADCLRQKMDADLEKIIIGRAKPELVVLAVR